MPDTPIIDADGHVTEPPDLWPRFLPRELHAYAPRFAFDSQGRGRQFIGGELKGYIPTPGTGWKPVVGGFDSKVRLSDMDSQGIDRSILFPTTGLFFAGVRELKIQTALCRAYNDWLHEFCSSDPKRLVGVAVVPQLEVSAAIEEAQRAVGELGFRAIMLRPNPIAGRNLDDPLYEPLWSAIEELGVPVAIHEGTTQDLPQSGDRFDNFLFQHVCSHPHEQQIAAMTFICAGILERHPDLRVVFLESGCGWIAHWLERLDEHMDSWGHASMKLAMTPSEYFERQCFISADPGERTIAGVVSLIGDDNILFASDYPHPDALADGIVDAIAKREGLSDQSKRKILGDNAMRCFGLS